MGENDVYLPSFKVRPFSILRDRPNAPSGRLKFQIAVTGLKSAKFTNLKKGLPTNSYIANKMAPLKM